MFSSNLYQNSKAQKRFIAKTMPLRKPGETFSGQSLTIYKVCYDDIGILFKENLLAFGLRVVNIIFIDRREAPKRRCAVPNGMMDKYFPLNFDDIVNSCHKIQFRPSTC
uniref:Uncharacterized protein n=1 Tax=Romanomermis culicivorax TaxID=13658 RepID=A0A915K4B5_ROMCU